jgi:hypothetical protein
MIGGAAPPALCHLDAADTAVERGRFLRRGRG